MDKCLCSEYYSTLFNHVITDDSSGMYHVLSTIQYAIKFNRFIRKCAFFASTSEENDLFVQ